MIYPKIIPEEINDNDLLGRACFSSKDGKKARLNHIKHTIFLEKIGELLLSVDRFDFCSFEELTDIQDKNAKARSTPESKRSFYGWAQIRTLEACQSGRKVKSSPLPNNRYHADIILPEDTNEDDQVEHANKLADNAKWVTRAD